MKSKIKSMLKILPYLAIAILVGITAVYAGSLTPPGEPAKSMKTISDLYELIDTGANTPSEDFTTPETVSETMHSLGDTYDLLATKIGDIDPLTILTGTTIFGVEGEAPAGASAPEFASADATTYQCSWFTDMTDPDDERVTPVTSAEICDYNTGCSWVEGACVGDVQDEQEASGGYMTWYAAKETCANSTEGDLPAGTWRLPTNIELLTHYMDNNDAGNPPTGFLDGYYWSSNTYQYPDNSYSAYLVGMLNGGVDYSNKGNENYLVRCAH